LVLAIVSIWGLPALIKTQGLFWKIGMMEHVVERGTVRLAGGGGFLPGYYFLTAILSLFPWVFFLPEAWQSYRQSASDRTVTPQTPDVRIFLGAWVLAVYGIFFFYRTQLPHYVLPAFPALFLLIATGLEQTVKPTGFIQGWRMVLGGLWVFILLAFGFLWLRGGGMSYSNDWKQIALFPILLLVGGGLMVRAWLRQTQRLVLMGFALLILGWSLAGTALRNVHPVIALEHSLIGYGSSFKLVGDGYSEPSLVFYTGAELLSGDLELTLKGDLITVRLLEEKDLGRWIKAAWSQREVQSKKVATPLIPSPGQKALFLEGVNIGRTSWVRLQVILPR
jgi:4-amino-4-deoxy-L-arabinose transferase-like glycosyltransferase